MIVHKKVYESDVNKSELVTNFRLTIIALYVTYIFFLYLNVPDCRKNESSKYVL